MKPYLLSLGVGLLVGAIYALLNVRSPAPPIIALLGLLGVLIGEKAVPLAKRLIYPQPIVAIVAPDAGDQARDQSAGSPGAGDPKA